MEPVPNLKASQRLCLLKEKTPSPIRRLEGCQISLEPVPPDSTTNPTKVLRSEVNIPRLKHWFYLEVITAETKNKSDTKDSLLLFGRRGWTRGTPQVCSGPKSLWPSLLFRRGGGKQDDAHTLNNRFILPLFKNQIEKHCISFTSALLLFWSNKPVLRIPFGLRSSIWREVVPNTDLISVLLSPHNSNCPLQSSFNESKLLLFPITPIHHLLASHLTLALISTPQLALAWITAESTPPENVACSDCSKIYNWNTNSMTQQFKAQKPGIC